MRLTLATCWCLASSIAMAAADCGIQLGQENGQDAAPKTAAPESTSKADAPSSGGAAAARRASARAAVAKKKADRKAAAKKQPAKDTGLAMEPGVVCKSIDGFENYVPLPGAAQTSDEKLLVYIRALGYRTEIVDGTLEGHLTVDGEVRRRGDKAVLRQKKKMLEYKPRAELPPQFVYLKNSVSLKGLSPGDYELTIILHDEIAKGAPASQVIKFKIIPPIDPSKVKEPSAPNELDMLYLPFLDLAGPEDDND
jgi:hypothetical protein